MSTTQKVLIVGGYTILGVAIVWLLVKPLTSDPPIYIGDGSVIFSHDSIQGSNNSTTVEARKGFHHVRSITVVGGTPPSIAVQSSDDWTLQGGAAQLQTKHYTFETGVVATCPSNWQGTGTLYICSPGASQFTPATLTFTSGPGRCPGPDPRTCTLRCGIAPKCWVEIEYK
jgi:hypothetical protein